MGGHAKIVQNGKHGFIDNTGKFTIKPTYDDMGAWFENGLVPAKRGDKWGYLDTSGNIKIPFVYDIADGFSENVAVVGIKNDDKTIKFGYINPQGDTIIPPNYDTASAFLDGVATVMADGSLYHINTQGQKTDF